MNPLRTNIVDEARTWLGTPYHHQAAVKQQGVDCAQILVEVYHAVGLAERPDIGYYPSDWMLHRSEERYLGWLDQYCRRIELAEVGPGDIVMFKFGRCFAHSGIVVHYPLIIHAQRQDNCCYANCDQGSLADKDKLYFSFFEADK